MSRIGNEFPKALALIPCEKAAHNDQTDQWTITGTFETMHTAKCPTLVPEINVYVALQRGSETHQIVHLAILDGAGGVVNVLNIGLDFNKDKVAQLEFTFHNTIFRRPGEYTLRLFMINHVLAERTIIISDKG